MSRLAAGLLALGAAGCTQFDTDECSESCDGGYSAPHGGGSSQPDDHDDEPEEVSDFQSLLGDECRTFVRAAGENPASDLQITAVPHSIKSSKEGGVLNYMEELIVDDEVDPDLARTLYPCVAWEVEGVESFAPNSDGLREGAYLTVGAETTPGLTDQVESLQLWVIVDEEGNRNNLRFGQFGSMDSVTRIVDQNAEEDLISE